MRLLTGRLAEIVAHRRQALESREREVPLSALREQVRDAPPTRRFAASLSRPGISLIAEVKRASPSKGALRPDLDAADLARAYQQGGATAISVLTEERYFCGSLADLQAVRQAVDLPLLRKDFLVSAYQVWESRVWGADAVLLIAAILEAGELSELRTMAEELGLDALVEVHDETDLAQALSAGSTLVGINNRDLTTFQVDLSTTGRIRPLIPPACLVVSESGVRSAAEVTRLKGWGVDAMLVGEELVRAPDLGSKLRELLA